MPATQSSSISVFGIRHHGPGCARSLRAALERLAPDIVLVEGPPDAQAVLPLIIHPEMRPPVALLIYPPDQPQRAVYYPFTVFSPEWQALRYATERGIPARFMDLPQAVLLARLVRADDAQVQPEAPLARETAGTPLERYEEEPWESGPDLDALLRQDPIGVLAQAAGYQDRELWWEHQVEQRLDATGLFEAILEMMAELRAQIAEPDEEEALREAQMRQSIRAARREGFARIAVVCGAWHAPALADPGPAKADAALLARLPRVAVQATWIPWTNSRLSYRSGYGAGIASPGWYEHLWSAPDRTAIRWVAHVARLLRAQDLDASPASVIETVRMADALAALRDLPMPGLGELNEATLTVLCHGEAAPMALIRDRLEIGERLGAVPEETPAVPLQRDLAAQQRRLRLPPRAEFRLLDLDLRKETDRERSRLLHRLHLLKVPWGEPQAVAGKNGTFHELWRVQWQPEFAVRLIEANVWGNTVETAATAMVREAARDTRDLPRLAALLDRAILAALPGAIDYILGCIGAAAAIAADVRQLMDALPGLARVARYGDARGTHAAHIIPVIDGLFERALAGITTACAALDDAAAAAMISSINAVQESVSLLDRDDQRRAWHAALRALLDRGRIHGLVRGRCCRLLLEAHILDDDDLQRRARLALSPVTPPAQAAAWVEGLLKGGALLLLHQDGIWLALDRWLLALDVDTFTAVLPLLRRAFADFQPPERRTMGERVARLTHDGAADHSGITTGPALNHERAAAVLPVLAQILGMPIRSAPPEEK